MPQPTPKVFRFGPFELDPKSGQLRSESGTHRLADQPLALLTALLERPGEMVSREELRLRLWPDGTFVDFDHGLNSAVSRLREELNDSANTPRFVETIPRRGYRLLVPVEAEGPVAGDALAPTEPLPADDATQQAAAAVAREPATAPPRRRARLAWMGVAAGLFVVLIAAVVQSRCGTGPVPLLASFVIDLPSEWIILNESPAISPDSRHIIFSAWNPRDGRRAIWHRPLETGATRMLAATEDGSAPFWSPDGKSIGFFAEGKLKTIPLAGGSARVVCDAVQDATGTWIRADAILFAPGPTGAVSEVNVEHGTVRAITQVDRSGGVLRHVRPKGLPDGRHFIYLANRKDQLVATLASVDGTDAVPLGTVQSHVVAGPSDLVVFVRDGTLLAQRLDVAAGRLTGDATVLAEGLTNPGGFVDGRFSTSPALLIYLKVRRQLYRSAIRIFDRAGKTVGTVGEPGEYTAPSLSPDGMRLAVARASTVPRARDIWVFDLERDNRLRLTLDPADDLAPHWSPDGQWLMFSSNRRGVRDIYKRRPSGDGADELVYESTTNKSVNGWSRDGRFLVYDSGGGRADTDLYVLPLVGDRRPIVVASEPGSQQNGDISPDGRLIVYSSSESGRLEVFVKSFPDNTGRRQISPNGGREPAWRGDGRELFFLSEDAVMAVDVHTSAVGVEWSAPRPLFKIPNYQSFLRGFTVSGDGQRFVAVVATTPAEPQKFTTVLNWTELVK